ncbi:TonB-dependent receptor [Aliiglaciecola sp. CAU 1673]|uniref:TonB-dependent receptor n=1 Tax=Aliiglaciecola sp. CAU 1673 TaxID=3032595 RepID=UPI0023D9CE17|nr:TonB-dependent receptor [Aliiglaciecola sp. CAU 1673]MDF2176710.1 TonB-dependent receptor [Aliiglaciecola sp. CAU 1673]
MHIPRFCLCLVSLPLYQPLTVQAADSDSVEVIRVNAQKHQQSLDDVALSVRYLDGESLAEQNIKDTTELSGQTVNFKITQNAAEGTPPALNIRGVGSLDYNTSTTSPIGLYQDGVAPGSANGLILNLYDLESVEILRGPQGTLFGRNTTGGAILINSKRPEHDFGGYINAGVGEQNLLKFDGAVNLPVNEHIATRLAVSHRDYDYSVNNLYAPAPQADMRQTQARWSILADYDDLEVFAKVYWGQWDGIVKPVGNIGVIKTPANPVTGQAAVLCTPAEAGSALCTDAFGFNDGSDNFYDVAVNNNINNNSPHTSDTLGADINLRYRLDDKSELYSVTGYSELDRVHFFNSDGSPAGLAEGGQDLYSDLFSQEFRYHRQFDDAYLIAGVFYLRESLTQDNFIDLFRDFRSAPELFSFAAQFMYDNEIDTKANAAFAHLDYELSEATTLSVGLRYSDEETRYRAIGTINVATAVGDQTGINVPGWNEPGVVSDSNWSGKVAINHIWHPSLNTYASFSRGFKSGGYNGAIITSQAEAARNDYGSESLNAFEVGGRAYWDKRNAMLQFALFNYAYQDQQVFMNQAAVNPNAPPIQLLDNVGRSRIYGAEAEMSWQLSEAFRSQLGIGYLPKAELKEFVDAGGNRIIDNRLPFTSKWNGNGFFDYVLPLSDGELQLQLNFDYQSAFYFDQNENPYARQGGYTLWNARIAYEFEDWTLALWGKNITDKEYSHLRFDLMGLLGMLQDFKGEARQLGVEVNYRF